MYCINCGKELPSDAKFCFNCGQKVVQEKNSNSIQTKNSEKITTIKFSGIKADSPNSKIKDLLKYNENLETSKTVIKNSDSSEKSIKEKQLETKKVFKGRRSLGGLPGTPSAIQYNSSERPIKSETLIHNTATLNANSRIINSTTNNNKSTLSSELNTDRPNTTYINKKTDKRAQSLLLAIIGISVLVALFLYFGYINREEEEPYYYSDTTTSDDSGISFKNLNAEKDDDSIYYSSDTLLNSDYMKSSYEYINANVSFDEAVKAAKEKGGHLAVIGSDVEFRNIAEMVTKYKEITGDPTIEYYVGAKLDPSDNTYKYIDADGNIINKSVSDTLSSNFWYTNEPSYYDGGIDNGGGFDETVLTISKINDVWYGNDSNAYLNKNYPNFKNKIGYIIEYDNYYE